MHVHIETEKNKILIDAAVTKIEVEDIVTTGEDDPVDSAFRTIRFVTYNGEAIEVFCKGFEDKNALRLHRVKELKPVQKPKEGDWLTPTVSQPTTGKKKQ